MIEPRLITFDFGDTLVTSEPSYLERTSIALSELGYPRTLEDVQTAYFRGDIHSANTLLMETPFTPDRFREVFSSNFFTEAGLIEKAEELAPPLTKWLTDLRPKRVMMPNARELLDKLRDAGYPMAIISNNDGFTRQKCEAVSIDDYFMFILDSTQEGITKPDPRIFLKALELAQLKPKEVLHVGDLWGCDVLGPHAVGINAAWLSNDLVDPEPVDCSWRIKELLELLDIVKP